VNLTLWRADQIRPLARDPARIPRAAAGLADFAEPVSGIWYLVSGIWYLVSGIRIQPYASSRRPGDVLREVLPCNSSAKSQMVSSCMSTAAAYIHHICFISTM